MVLLNLCNVEATTNKTIVEYIFSRILRQIKMGKFFGEKIVVFLIFGNGEVYHKCSIGIVEMSVSFTILFEGVRMIEMTEQLFPFCSTS